MRLSKRFVLAALSATALLSVSFAVLADGCDVEIVPTDSYGQPTPGGAWIRVTGRCTTRAEAEQACNAFAAEHGYVYQYPYEACNNSSIDNKAVWVAGWLKESNTGGPQGQGIYPPFYLLRYYYAQYYLSLKSPSQCDVCVADPINPASGAVFNKFPDLSGRSGDALDFNRFYNSTRLNSVGLSDGWRHAFSRMVKPANLTISIQEYQPDDPNNSPLYNDPATACTSGFSLLKSKIPNWSSGVSNYISTGCNISVGGIAVGSFLIHSNLNAPFSAQSTLGIDVIRDDGQTFRFLSANGTILSPSGIDLKLRQTGTGFAVTDNKDNVEVYDTNGKLLTVTSRGGVVQTMSYDGNGRLSGVSDSFGHQLIFNYDAQGRLTTVERQ